MFVKIVVPPPFCRKFPVPVMTPEARVESVLRYFTPDRPAVLVKTGKSSYDIVTKYDVVNAVSRASEVR